MAETRGLVVVPGETPTVAIDFDLTIVDEKEALIPGASEALRYLRQTGWKIIIWTARTDLGFVEKFLKDNALPFDNINENPEADVAEYSRKIFFHATVDDKAIPFEGDWTRPLVELERRRSIWQLTGETKTMVKIQGASRDRILTFGEFCLEGNRAVETSGSKHPIVRDLLEHGLETENGVVFSKSGPEFLRALLDFQGAYLWAEVSST